MRGRKLRSGTFVALVGALFYSSWVWTAQVLLDLLVHRAPVARLRQPALVVPARLLVARPTGDLLTRLLTERGVQVGGSPGHSMAPGDAAKAKKLPVVVSMGNVAASGGYWVATGTDYIFAEPSTITGSIGVFGILPSFQGSLEKLIGGDTSAIRELLTNDKARDAALTAIGNDPGIKAQLEQIGLTPEDLVAAGRAAPKIMEAFEKLQSGDVKGALTDFQAAVQTAPELAAKLGQKLLEALIGEAAVADIIRAAERDLRRTLRSALESDARRFLDLLAPAGEGPDALRAAADRVLAEAERLIASLGGASERA